MKKFLIITLSLIVLSAAVFGAITKSKAAHTKKKSVDKQVVESNATQIKSLDELDTLMQSMGIQRFKAELEAPNFVLKNLEGNTVALDDFRGKVVFMSFMATWCHWCRKEMPHIQKLYERFKDDDFVILTLFGDREGVRVVKPFMKKSGFTFTKNTGLLDNTGRVTSLYAVRGTPTTYLIGKDGNAIGRAVGYREWASKDAFELIAGLLAYDNKVLNKKMKSSAKKRRRTKK